MLLLLVVSLLALQAFVCSVQATTFSPDAISKQGAPRVSWSYPNESLSDSPLDFSLQNGVPVATIQVEITSPFLHTTRFIAECDMPTEMGRFKTRAYEYQSAARRLDPIALVSGDVFGKENVLVRVHDQCLTSEVFGSKRCDCKEQLAQSLEMVQNNPTGGVVIYLQQEGRGIGIANKIAAYALQDKGVDTVDANTQLGFSEELREYSCIPDILRDLGIKSIRLLTNNPYKIEQLTALGVNITERLSIQVRSNPHNEKYLRVKRDRMSHFLTEEVIVNKPIEQRATRPFTRGGALSSSARKKASEGAQHVNSPSSASTAPATARHPERPGLAGGCSTTTQVLGGTEVSVDNGTEPTATDPVIAHSTHPATTSKPYALGRDTVVAAIAAVKAGQVVVVVDDADRENEGDLIIAAAHATAQQIGFIVRHSSGVLCVSLEGNRLDELRLPPMVRDNEDPKQTAYSVSVDYKHGTSTGISASDRALTFRKLVDPTATLEDFQRPGHVFPLRYKPGGVLSRAGHTEASLDLTRLAGLPAGGVLAEVVRDDGSMMRFPELVQFAAQHHLVLTSVQDIIAYRAEMEGGI